MPNSKNIQINSLDFDTIRASLKEYLSEQDTFRDYDFEGSGISVLLDLLAYHSYQQGFYNNMVANEMFLDSAIKRDSVVSHAKGLGYTPRSTRSAKATVDITFGSTAGLSSTFPIGSKFNSTSSGRSYQFTNRSSATINLDAITVGSGATAHISNLEITEGTLNQTSYIVDNSNLNQKFIIPDLDVDTSTITVNVQTSATDNTGRTDLWSEAPADTVDIEATTKCYFVEQGRDEKYEIVFGDGVVGLKPASGSLVTITYLRSSGSDANSLSTFIHGSGTNTITTISNAAGGSTAESVASIRFNAPRQFASQNRAVTSDDYVSLILAQFGNIRSAFVFGGEDANPPQFGKVLISLVDNSGFDLSDQQKREISDYVSSKSVVGVKPLIVAPDITYLTFATVVFYDDKALSSTQSTLLNNVRTTIKNYVDSTVGVFDGDMIRSKLAATIDATDVSILGSVTNIGMQKRITPFLDSLQTYQVTFNNPIEHPHDGHMTVFTSTEFTVKESDGTTYTNAFIDDDGSGILRLKYRNSAGQEETIRTNAGTIDYASGRATVTSIRIMSLSGTTDYITFTAPLSKTSNAYAERSAVLFVDSDQSNAITVDGLSESNRLSGLIVDAQVANYFPEGVSTTTTSGTTTTTVTTVTTRTPDATLRDTGVGTPTRGTGTSPDTRSADTSVTTSSTPSSGSGSGY